MLYALYPCVMLSLLNIVHSFTQQTTVEVPGLKPGMKLEAVDRNNPPSFCVATVIQQVGQRVRIRYDGFGKDSSNDCWCNFQAEELHPIGWCAQNGYPLQPPKGTCMWKTILNGTWIGQNYLPLEFLVLTCTDFYVNSKKLIKMISAQHSSNNCKS